MKKLSKKLLSVFLMFAMLVPTGALMINASAETTVEGNSQILYDFEYVTGEENKDAPNYVSSFTFPTYSATWLGENANAGYASRRELAQALYNQDIPLYMWPNPGVGDTTNTAATATVVSYADGEPVRFGDKSLRIDFDYSNYNYSLNANFYLRTTAPAYQFEGSPTAIGVWVYAPEGTTAYQLYLQCAGNVIPADNDGAGSGVSSYQCLTTPEAMGTDTKGISWTGWRYLEFDLTGTKGFTGSSNVGSAYEPYGQKTDNGVFWISYQPSNMGTDVTSDTIYIDNITLIYDDMQSPEINYIGSIDEEIIDMYTVFESNTNTFMARYSIPESDNMSEIDDSATKMYIDGIDVTDKCFIDADNNTIWYYDAFLDDGIHDIKISVADLFGNIAIESRTFIVVCDHDYIAVRTYPTCTEDGYTTYTCECGDSYVDNHVDALGHSETTIEGYAPTCKADGLTDMIKCDRCDAVIQNSETIPATNHEGTIMILPGSSATCTADGMTDGKFCTLCGDILETQEVIPSEGHKEEVVPGKTATCTQSGLTEGSKCSVCNMIFVAQIIIPATEHNYEFVITEPTETEDGYTTYTCADCGYSYISDYTEFAPEEDTTEDSGNALTKFINALKAFFAKIAELFAKLFNA